MVEKEMLNLKDLKVMLDMSEMTIYRLEKKGDFPARRKLTGKKVGWVAREVRDWITSRPAVA